MTTPEGNPPCNCYKCYIISQTNEYVDKNPHFTAQELIASLGASLIEVIEAYIDSERMSDAFLEKLLLQLAKYARRPSGMSIDLEAIRAATNCETN